MPTETTTKWQGKDAIRLAVFSLLLFMAMLIGAIPLSITLTSYFYGDALGAVLAGIVWMYMRATIRKPWACLLSSLIVAVIALLLGQIWTAVLGIVIGGLLSEAIVRIGGYGSVPANIVAFVVWVLCFWVGHGILAVFSADMFAQMMMNAHMSAEQVDMLLQGISGKNLILAPIACVAGSLAGGFLGYAVFKKHFQRAL
ncbi:MptD family putative ECF transporter S component [Slackia exigua]|uniref:MptD family putative ECF transporter S component n=1 Tax=Slackia exigua TaxID=84109 RepID=UPI0028D11D93|nr:MptD family putative ECF transporter S component [Slackia exigua]